MMTATLDGKDGDSRFHISLKSVKEYVERRKQRGEVHYNNGSVLVTFPNFVDRLAAPISEGGLNIINEDQLAIALKIKLLRDIALDKLDIVTQREYAAWYDLGEGPRHPETVYVRVMRRLATMGPDGHRQMYSHMIERVCFHTVKECDHAWISRQADTIRTAFNMLGDTISDVVSFLTSDIKDEEGKSFDQICRDRYETHRIRQEFEKTIKRPHKPS